MATLLEYKCPCCGGAIQYDSNAGKPKCPYCDTEFDIETLEGWAQDSAKSEASEDTWEENASEWSAGEADGLRVYVCKSCAGEIIADETTAASACPYCGSPVIMKGQLDGDLRPDLVIPFKFDKKAAKEAYKKHLSGKPLLPKVFKDENRIDEIKGVYVPFWLYDAATDASILYRATKVRSYTTPSHYVTETSYYSVTRRGNLAFANVPVDGSGKMADDLMESVEPFDISEAVDFSTAYLSGYLADRYDVDSKQSRPRAAERMKKSTEQVIRNTVQGYTTVMTTSSNVSIGRGSVKYVLYPVWILNTTWKDEKFTFAMNGQTGKFVGNLPTDMGAFVRRLFFGTCIASVVVYILLVIFNLLGG